MCQLKNFHSLLFFLVSQELYLPHTNQRYLSSHLHPEFCLPSDEFGLFVYLLSFNFFPFEKRREWEIKINLTRRHFCFLSPLATMLQQIIMPNGNLLITEINTKLLWRIVSISIWFFFSRLTYYTSRNREPIVRLTKSMFHVFSGNNFNNIYQMPTPGHAVWQHVMNIRPV